MKLSSRTTQFLARDTYRMRRLMDAARMLPVVGLILLLLPLMRLDSGAESPPTAAEAVYLFLVWISLIVIAFVMSLWLRRTLGPPRPPVAPLAPHDPDPDTPAPPEDR